MDWINDPTTREIALKVIVAFITALLAALGVNRQAWKGQAQTTLSLFDASQLVNQELRTSLAMVRTNLAASLDARNRDLIAHNAHVELALSEAYAQQPDPGGTG